MDNLPIPLSKLVKIALLPKYYRETSVGEDDIGAVLLELLNNGDVYLNALDNFEIWVEETAQIPELEPDTPKTIPPIYWED